MFDSLGFQELILIGLVAMLVVGPKDLPLLMRKMGRWVNKMRGMAADFRASFDDLARQAELDELRKEVESLKSMQPLRDIETTLAAPVDTGIDLSEATAPKGRSAFMQPEATATVPTPQPELVVEAATPKPKKPRAPRKPKPVVEAASPSDVDLP